MVAVSLKNISKKVNLGVREFVDEYILENGNRIYVLGDGRLINLVAAEGHPASVMDMSFSVQALMAEHTTQNDLEISVHTVPKKIDELVAKLKLDSMGISIDTLTSKQTKYLASWQEGT